MRLKESSFGKGPTAGLVGGAGIQPGSGAPPGTQGDQLPSDTWGAEKWGFDIKLKYFLGTLECLKLSAMKHQCVLLWAFGF